MKLKKKMPYRGKYSGNLWIDPKTLKEKDLDDSYTKKLWLDELQKDPDFLNDMKDMVEGRINKLKPFMDIHKAKVHIAGESHLDMAYKWRIDQTKQKAVKTLRKAVNHCETFPEA